MTIFSAYRYFTVFMKEIKRCLILCTCPQSQYTKLSDFNLLRRIIKPQTLWYAIDTLFIIFIKYPSFVIE